MSVSQFETYRRLARQALLRATVQGLPTATDISLPVDANIVVEFLSR